MGGGRDSGAASATAAEAGPGANALLAVLARLFPHLWVRMRRPTLPTSADGGPEPRLSGGPAPRAAHHVLEGPQDGGREDAQEHTQHVERCRGPKQPVEVKHVLTAAHAHELVVGGGVFRAAQGQASVTHASKGVTGQGTACQCSSQRSESGKLWRLQ